MPFLAFVSPAMITEMASALAAYFVNEFGNDRK